jgi:hypothetical protein
MSRSIRPDHEALRGAQARAQEADRIGDGQERGRIGDKVGYALLQEHAGEWVNVDGWQFDNITQAVGMLKDYQEEDLITTFAVARLELVMISRPDEAARA